MLVALAVNEVPIDVLAERLNTTRGALYKTLHDARRKLRAALAARGLGLDEHEGGRQDERDATGRADRLLARLLGPAGPEVSCEECFEELDRYVELELAGADADAAVPGHARAPRGCSACAEDRDALRALLLADAGQDPGRRAR